jgi:hypothetical protein
MLILKSDISKPTKLQGKSLVSLCKLSVNNSSRENIARLTAFVNSQTRGVSAVSLNKPEAYFHASDMVPFLKEIVSLLNAGVHVEMSIYGDEIINLVGRFIADNLILETEVELQLELPPMLNEKHGEVDIVRYDSEGYLKEPYKIGYFDYGYFNYM